MFEIRNRFPPCLQQKAKTRRRRKWKMIIKEIIFGLRKIEMEISRITLKLKILIMRFQKKFIRVVITLYKTNKR